MALGTLPTLVVTGTYDSAVGAAQAGAVLFTPSAAVEDAAGRVVISAVPNVASLSGGSFSITLPCTDTAGMVPAGWLYNVNVAVAGAQQTFTTYLPKALGGTAGTVDITALAPVTGTPSPSGVAYLPNATSAPSSGPSGGGGFLYSFNGTLYWLNGDNTPVIIGPGSASGQGLVPPAGDIGGTGLDPTVLSTHLASPLPWVQGGNDVGVQQVYYLDSYTGTDDQKMTSALVAVFAGASGGLPGGTIILSPRAHTFANQWSTSYSAGVVTAVKIQGAGPAFNGGFGTPSAATTCDMRYAGAGAARLDFQHIGTIELSGIEFKDTVSSSVPFFQTTNATPNIHDCVWNGSATGSSAYQDAILLGGTGMSSGAGDTAIFQGYAADIYRNFFSGIRRAVTWQSAANAVNVHNNTISLTCGDSSHFGAPFAIRGNSTYTVNGAHIYDNLVEATFYQAVVNGAGGYAINCLFGPNTSWDASVGCFAYLDATCSGCAIDDRNYRTAGGTYNAVKGPVAPTTYDVLSSRRRNQFGLATVAFYLANVTRTVGVGAQAESAYGDTCWLFPVSYGTTTGHPAAQVCAQNGHIVTDGSIVSGSPIVTSATAAFAEGNIGAWMTGAGSGPKYILDAYSAGSWQITWVASTAHSLGDVVIPTSQNSHLYQCTTAGTTSSTQPTWPTGGGTVTDNTVVWTDLGTGVTAAYLSANANTGGTAVSLFFGPGATTAQAMTIFNNHHIIGSGGTPAWTPQAAAGSTATCSATGTDIGQVVTLVTAGTPTSGVLATGLAAQNAYNTNDACAISPANAAAGTLMSTGGGVYCSFTGSAPGTWTLGCNTAPGVSTYKFNILMLG